MRFLSIVFSIIATTAAADLCDGRYDHARTLIDQAYADYGTLYTGDYHTQSLGAQIELYRLMTGLPDAGHAVAPNQNLPYLDPGYILRDPDLADHVLGITLSRLSDPYFQRDAPNGRTDSEILLNRLTPVGAQPGWWLTPDAPYLSAVEAAIASYADADLLDWILTTQAASTRPHTLSWTLQQRIYGHASRANEMRPLFVHALEKYQETQSLPWLIATMMVNDNGFMHWNTRPAPSLETIFSGIAQKITDLTNAVTDCQATPADYAAFAIATYEQERFARGASFSRNLDEPETLFLLPASLRLQIAVQRAKILISSRSFLPNGETFFTRTADLRALANNPAFDSWLNTGLSYRANTINDLIRANANTPLHQLTYELTNILSADDLLAFGQSRTAFPDEHQKIVTSAFLRHIALGHDDVAAGLVPQIAELWPERHDLIHSVWSRRGTLGYRLSMVALALPEPRLLITQYDGAPDFRPRSNEPLNDNGVFWGSARRLRDLARNVRTGGYLTQNYRRWMQTVNTVGAGNNAIRRAFRRGHSFPDPTQASRYTPLAQSQAYGGHGIAGFAAWNELSRLGPETGLANRIGREIIANARRRTSSPIQRLFSDQTAVADELELVIWQGRRMIHGELDDKPLGQVAFEVLHDRLGRTDTAQRNPYWYICQDNCVQ